MLSDTSKLKRAIIVDIDGTICDTAHRVHFVRNEEGKKDWKSFYEAMDGDLPRMEVVEEVGGLYKSGIEVILVSGRPEEYRERTLAWALKHDLPFIPAQLFMRKDGDYRADTIVKQEIYDEFIKDRYNIHMAFDDRPAVIRMWESNGITVKDVGDGQEF